MRYRVIRVRWGRVFGVLALGAALVGGARYVEQRRAAAQRGECSNRLRQIALAITQFRNDKKHLASPTGETFPELLQRLKHFGYLDRDDPVCCPSGHAYDGVHGGSDLSNQAIVWDSVPHRADGAELRGVALGDCTVRWLFREELKLRQLALSALQYSDGSRRELLSLISVREHNSALEGWNLEGADGGAVEWHEAAPLEPEDEPGEDYSK